MLGLWKPRLSPLGCARWGAAGGTDRGRVGAIRVTNALKCTVEKRAARMQRELALLVPGGVRVSLWSAQPSHPSGCQASGSSQPAPPSAGKGQVVGGGRGGKGGVTGGAGFPQIEIDKQQKPSEIVFPGNAYCSGKRTGVDGGSGCSEAVLQQPPDAQRGSCLNRCVDTHTCRYRHMPGPPACCCLLFPPSRLHTHKHRYTLICTLTGRCCIDTVSEVKISI